MNFLGLILPDEMASRIAMTEFSDLPAHMQILLGLVGVRLTVWALTGIVDLYDYVSCDREKRQELRDSRRWLKRWRG